MPSKQIRENVVNSARTIVIKIGTAVLTGNDGKLDEGIIRSIANQVRVLSENKKNVIIVSSGAIGAGMGILCLTKRPKTLPQLQASASIGQGKLIQLFEKTLAKHNLHTAQILLTRSDFEDRKRYINIERTLSALHKFHAIPIINENDTVSVDEIRFGDNDLIAALLANLARADILMILSVVDGLLDKQGLPIDYVESVSDQTMLLLRSEKTMRGVGGMRSKLQAIKLATQTGINTVLANGKRKHIITDLIIKGKKLGTVFAAGKKRVRGKRRWIALAAKPKGTIVIDEGASRAILSGGKSLLPGGIVKLSGNFLKGDVLKIADTKGKELARGTINYNSENLDKIRGKRTGEIKKILGTDSPDEAIHRDNLIINSE